MVEVVRFSGGYITELGGSPGETEQHAMGSWPILCCMWSEADLAGHKGLRWVVRRA
jgi:hypothetical protein